MKTITEEEIFNRVATHLFTQGRDAFCEVRHQCLYRGPNGLKCAVGCLIPDELYDPEFEGKAVTQVYQKALPEEYHEHIDLLIDLQDVHDRSASWKSPAALFRELRDVAAMRNIDTAAIDKYRDKTAWEGEK